MSGFAQIQPEINEFEIVLFGSGRGESILIHIGNNEWLIVDSCIDRETRLPCALKYLDSINVDASTQVIGVVITHWHDDHINGVSQIVKKCIAADFFLSAALMSSQNSDIFKKLILDSPISRLAHLNADSKSGVDEFREVLETLRLRNKYPKYALNNKLLIDRNDTQLWSLAPHDSTFQKAIDAIVSQIDMRGCA
jgi:glyoxylase-like metal-dependent hydrolase (beta-lactamase superfamily II)